MQLSGGYYWAALLADGTVVEQIYKENGQERERSVDFLRGKPVKEIHLIPLNRATHAPIVLRINEDEDWLKFWTREVKVDPVTSEIEQQSTIDTIALRPVGRSRKPVRAYIYPDGSILITTDKEP